jgi:hypothetical protein
MAIPVTANCLVVLKNNLAVFEVNLGWFSQGTLIEGKGSVWLTSSIRKIVLLNNKNVFSALKHLISTS